MNRYIPTGLAMLILCGSQRIRAAHTPAAHAKPPSLPRAQVEAANQESASAWRQMDLAKLKALRTDDFVFKGPDGSVEGLKPWAADVGQLLKVVKRVKEFRTKIVSMVPRGSDVVVVTDGSSLYLTAVSQDFKPGEHLLARRTTLMEIWTRTPKGWRIKRDEMLKSEIQWDPAPAVPPGSATPPSGAPPS